jgi:hypothetical protein
MANSNDAMDAVQHNVRILDEALVRLEGGDETAREEAKIAIRVAVEVLRRIYARIEQSWLDTGTGAGWPPPDDPNHDPRD